MSQHICKSNRSIPVLFKEVSTIKYECVSVFMSLSSVFVLSFSLRVYFLSNKLLQKKNCRIAVNWTKTQSFEDVFWNFLSLNEKFMCQSCTPFLVCDETYIMTAVERQQKFLFEALPCGVHWNWPNTEHNHAVGLLNTIS